MYEPNTCYFCKQAADPSCTLVKPLFMETSRSLLPRKVEFKKTEVSIPRCSACMAAQSRSQGKSRNILAICVIAGVGIGHFAGEHHVIGGAVGAALGIVLSMRTTKTIARDGVLDDSNDTLKSYPDAIPLIKQGWTYSQPTA